VGAGDKPFSLRARIGERLDVEFGLELRAPVALSGPDTAGESLARVSVSQVVGVEVLRRLGIERERYRAEALSRIVDGVDGDLAVTLGAVDDTREALQRLMGGGNE